MRDERTRSASRHRDDFRMTCSDHAAMYAAGSRGGPTPSNQSGLDRGFLGALDRTAQELVVAIVGIFLDDALSPEGREACSN